MSEPTHPRTKTQLNRAQLKAYETRRAEEGQRHVDDDGSGDLPIQVSSASAIATPASRRRIYALSHEQEMAIIRSDLNRLLKILAVLLVVLAIATVLLG